MTTKTKIERDALTRWMTVYLATITGDPSDSIDIAAPLAGFDLDSVDAVVMALELEKTFDLEVHPETFLDGDLSIDDVAARLC